MKEVLYRGKRKKDGKWIYSNLLTAQKGNFTTYVGNYNDENCLADEMTVGIYTNKDDKKGNKIFTDDIVKYNGRYYIIRYLFPYFWVIGKDICKPFIYFWSWELKVCGNRFDNPKQFKKIYQEYLDNNK